MLPNNSNLNNAAKKSRKPATLLKRTPSKAGSSQLAKVANASKSSLTRRIRGLGSKAAVAPAPPSSTTTTTAMSSVPTPLPSSTVSKTPRYVWYLGNPIVKLLTSVDGDLDATMLEGIAEVPACVGDLALSVECLVSEDATEGGFESELLAKIAQNTLSCIQQQQQNKNTPASTTTTNNTTPANTTTTNAPPTMSSPPPPTTAEEDHSATALSSSYSMVPNPLKDYAPVPNPLARITPPGSPTPARQDLIASR